MESTNKNTGNITKGKVNFIDGSVLCDFTAPSSFTQQLFGVNLFRNKLWHLAYIDYMSPVKQICVFEHSVITNFNC